MGTLQPSICRMCTNGCGVLVEVEDGRAVRLTGDPDNPVYDGYTCLKGRALPTLMNHPDRLLHSLRRTATGGFEPIPVEQAMDEIAARLLEIRERHGPRAIAGYAGTAQFATLGAAFVFFALLDAIGTPMRFTPNTIDKPGKEIALALHGTWMAPATGFDDPRAVLLVGINPLVTYTGFPSGHPGKWLRGVLDSGAALIVIDPRRSDVARRATLHLQPRPGTDADILAAMLRVIVDEHRYDAAFVAENAVGLDALVDHLAPFTPGAVATRADVDAADIVRAARLFADAGRGYAMAGTGPSMSGPGTLVEYLLLDLVTLCGYWQRAGDQVLNPRTLLPTRAAKAQASPPTPANGFGPPMRVRGLRGSPAGLPTAALADEILEDGDGRVRALISVAGNPVAAFPDQRKTIEAMRALELLVQVDPWMSQTAELATYVIAPTMCLETPGTSWLHADVSIMKTGYGTARAYGQYTPALARRPHGSDVIEEWELYYGLAQRMGLALSIGLGGSRTGPPMTRVELDMTRKPTSDELLERFSAGSRVPLSEVKRYPHGALWPDPPLFVEPKDDGWTGRFELADTDMMADLATVAAGARPTPVPLHTDDAYAYRLVCRRHAHMYNSQGNRPRVHRARPYNPAFMHPDDLAALGLRAGDAVDITSPGGSIVGVVQPDDDLRRGMISMAFGFGAGDDGDFRETGSSPTRLVRDDVDYDRYSGQPRMSNVPVNVAPHREERP